MSAHDCTKRKKTRTNLLATVLQFNTAICALNHPRSTERKAEETMEEIS